MLFITSNFSLLHVSPEYNKIKYVLCDNNLQQPPTSSFI